MSKASQRAVQKYEKKTYDRIALRVRKDAAVGRAVIQAAADRAGQSVQAYILQAIAERVERDAAEQ